MTRQNEELRRVTKSQNEERQWILENQNEDKRRRIEGNHNKEGSDSQENKRIRTPEENSSRMESKLRKMRREMDELKNAIKDRAVENLDGMIQRTDSPFTTEVLNRPLPQKFRLPQLESFDGSKDPMDHIKLFKTLMLLHMTPNKVICRAFPIMLKVQPECGLANCPQAPLRTSISSAKVLFTISLVDNDTRSQLGIFSTYAR